MAVGKETEKGAGDSLRSAVALYESIEAEHMAALEATGIVFAPYDAKRTEREGLLRQLSERGARIRNGGASVALGPMSVACEACTGSCVSRSFALTNNCHRDCFFCFNPNQEDFAYWCERPFPWRRQLDDLAAEPCLPACIALTGGEPLLMADEAVAFFSRASELFPAAHLRLYTSGDLLSRDLIDRLVQAGLHEIRFSVKQDDKPELLEKVLERMAWARELVPTVMVEMPVIPGTDSFMKELLVKLDALGVDGINLLEFAYAMWNWPVFDSLGLTLRNPPQQVVFDYTYAGALAVQDSEEDCLRLMLWAHEQSLELSLHYCSLENKHRAQMRNTNEPFADIHPCYAFDYDDFFLKTALAFDSDRDPVRRVLEREGCHQVLEDTEGGSLAFHPRWLPVARRAVPEPGRLCVSFNVAVDEGRSLRELKVAPADELSVQLVDGTGSSDACEPCLQGFEKRWNL